MREAEPGVSRLEMFSWNCLFLSFRDAPPGTKNTLSFQPQEKGNRGVVDLTGVGVW